MRAVSLFSGAGGFEIGFERSGIQTVLQAEIDPWCLSVLERHWPETARVADVKSVGIHQQTINGRRSERNSDTVFAVAPAWSDGGEQSTSQRVDLIYGGFPCQDVSVAGQRAGLSGERSGLWHEFHRVLREMRPRWCVVENVPGLFSSNGGRDFLTILQGLDELGYGVAWRILDARYFGVPQRRRRVFIVGCLGNPIGAGQVLAVCSGCGGNPAPRRETSKDLAPTLDDGARGTSLDLPLTAYSLPASTRGTGDGHGNAWNSNYIAATLSGGGHPGSNMPGRHHEDDDNLVVARSQTSRNERIDAETENLLVAGALRASDGHHGHSSPRGDGADNLIGWQGGVRRLTPLECERLMGWPDGWTQYTAEDKEIPDSRRYQMCGNGVVATVAEWIGHRLVKVHNDDW